MRDALVLVDVVQTFEHEDGARLLESFRARRRGFAEALEQGAVGLPTGLTYTPGMYADDDELVAFKQKRQQFLIYR